MPLAHWFRPPLRTLTMFLGLVIVLGGALACLGWQVIESDSRLERSGAQERVTAATDRISAALRQRMSDLERLATTPGLAPAIPVGVVVLHVTLRSFQVQPAGVLVFQPIVPPAHEAPAGMFDARSRRCQSPACRIGALGSQPAVGRTPNRRAACCPWTRRIVTRAALGPSVSRGDAFLPWRSCGPRGLESCSH